MDRNLTLGRIAYYEYAKGVNHKNFIGKEMPEFDDLTEEQRLAWYNMGVALFNRGKEDGNYSAPATTCRAVCTGKTKNGKSGANIILHSVYSVLDNEGNYVIPEENKKFFESTPSLQISMYCVGESAHGIFEENASYNVTFNKI